MNAECADTQKHVLTAAGVRLSSWAARCTSSLYRAWHTSRKPHHSYPDRGTCGDQAVTAYRTPSTQASSWLANLTSV